MNPSWCWLLWSPFPPPRFYGYQETLIQSMVPKSHSQPPFGMHNTPVNNGRYLPNINWWVSESRISNGWTIQQYEFAALSKTWSRPSATILRLRPRDKVMHCRWRCCHRHSQGLKVGLRQLGHTLKPWHPRGRGQVWYGWMVQPEIRDSLTHQLIMEKIPWLEGEEIHSRWLWTGFLNQQQ